MTFDKAMDVVIDNAIKLPYKEAKGRLVSDFNLKYARALMERCGDNQSEAARQAGIDRAAFRRLLIYASTTHPNALIRRKDKRLKINRRRRKR